MKLINTIVIWWLKTTGQFKELPDNAVCYHNDWYVQVQGVGLSFYPISNNGEAYKYRYQQLLMDEYGQYRPTTCWLSTNDLIVGRS